MTPTSRVIRIILADEMMLMREGVAKICESTQDFQVVAQCSDGGHAVKLIEELSPDVAILDWDLPVVFPLEIARQVRATGKSTKIAVLTTRTDRRTVAEALRSGVSAFLLKSGPSLQIREAIESLLEGRVYVSPLLGVDEKAILEAKPLAGDAFGTLSPREFQVFTMLVDGLRAKEIAARLGLSPKTVDTYRSSLMQKLEIYDVAGLVKFAIQREMINSR